MGAPALEGVANDRKNLGRSHEIRFDQEDQVDQVAEFARCERVKDGS